LEFRVLKLGTDWKLGRTPAPFDSKVSPATPGAIVANPPAALLTTTVYAVLVTTLALGTVPVDKPAPLPVKRFAVTFPPKLATVLTIF
jgi:hypothetical protein